MVNYDEIDGYQARINGKGDRACDSKRSKFKYLDYDKEVLKIFSKGTKINDRYEIVCPLDRGKFGQIIKCIDL